MLKSLRSVVASENLTTSRSDDSDRPILKNPSSFADADVICDHCDGVYAALTVAASSIYSTVGITKHICTVCRA